jgi:hypothetical protein
MQFVALSLGYPDGRDMVQKFGELSKRLEPLVGPAGPEEGFSARWQNAAAAVGQMVTGSSAASRSAAWGSLLALSAGSGLREKNAAAAETWEELARRAGASPEAARCVADFFVGLGAVGDAAALQAVDGSGRPPVALVLRELAGQFAALGDTLGSEPELSGPSATCRETARALDLLGNLSDSPLAAARPGSAESCAVLLAEANQTAVSDALSTFQQLINEQWKLIEENFERLCLNKPQFATPAGAWQDLQSLATSLESVLSVAQEIIGPTGTAEAVVDAPRNPGGDGVAQLADQLAALRRELAEFLAAAGHGDPDAKFPRPGDVENFLKSLLAWVKEAEHDLKGKVENVLREIETVAEKAWADLQNILHPPPNVGPPEPTPKVNTIGMALEQLASLTSSLTASLNSRGWQDGFLTALEEQAVRARVLRELAATVPQSGPGAAGAAHAQQMVRLVADAVARSASPEVQRTATAQLESLQANVQALSLAIQSVPAATAAAAEALSTDPVAERFGRVVADVVAAGGVPSTANAGGASADLAARARLLDEGLFHLRKVFANAESERARAADSVRRYAAV